MPPVIVPVEESQLLSPEGKLAKDYENPFDDDKTRKIYRGMLLNRKLDDYMMLMQRQGRIAFYGESRGEEASVVGQVLPLKPADWVFPGIRNVGAMLWRGYSVDDFCAQNLGNSNDCCKGRQQPIHYSDGRINHVSWASCISTQLPHAVGMAMAARLKGDDLVAMAITGDGGSSTSDFHVALNFAGVYDAPVVFVVQNNQWAISVPTERQTSSGSYAIKGVAYGMPYEKVDGNDIFAVYEASRKAIDRARNNEGPSLIECNTFRLSSHTTADDWTRYRAADVVESWQALDPLIRMQRFMSDQGIADEDWFENLENELQAEIKEAFERQENVPKPDATTMFTDVFATQPWYLKEQEAEQMRLQGLASDSKWNTPHTFP